MALQLRRGTDSERLLITPVIGELIYTTDDKKLYAGDGSTAGGVEVGGGSSTLNALTDTDLTGASNNDVLTYNAGTSKWESVAVPGLGTIELNEINNVFVNNAVYNDALVYDGANWSNRSILDFFQEQQNYKINIVGDDSTIIIDTDTSSVRANTITAINGFAGDLTGNVLGNHNGDVLAVNGTLVLDNGTDGTDSAFIGRLKSTGGQIVFNNGTDGTDAVFTGTLQGPVIGNVTGDLTGNANGAHTGTFDGDVSGSLFADDSTIIIDAISRRITAEQVNAIYFNASEIQAEGILDLKSVTNIVRTKATGLKLVSQTVGGGVDQGPVHRTETSRGTLAAPTTVAVGDSILAISGDGYDGAAYKTQAVINIGVSENTVGTEATPGRIDFGVRDDNGTFNTSFARLESNGVFTAPAIQSLGITTTDKVALLAKVSGGLGLQGTIVYDTTLNALTTYHPTVGWGNILTSVSPVETSSFIKPGVYADNTARDTAISSPEAGMMVFNTAGTKFQGYTGSAWVDLN